MTSRQRNLWVLGGTGFGIAAAFLLTHFLVRVVRTTPPDTPGDAGAIVRHAPPSQISDAAVIAPPLADDSPRPAEGEAVRAVRIEARQKYQRYVSAARLDADTERNLRAFLYAYQTQFFAARVANIMGTSDAGTAEEQISGYRALDAKASSALRQLLSPPEHTLFLNTFTHPRALIVHKFFAAAEGSR